MFCARCHRQYSSDHRFCPYDGQPLEPKLTVELLPAKATKHSGDLLGGRYEVRGFIGKGAMARVYLALDRETQKPVAVKILDRAQARTPRARERFLREAHALERLAHPNIVKIFASGERPSDSAPFLVMEYLFGESLGEMLRRQGALEPDIGLPIVRHAAQGIAAAHRAGIIHRDIKPDNIFLVGEPGDPYAVKVLDFGLAKLDLQSGFTQAGVAIGTLEYMAPEQVVSDVSDARTDVYGLGVVMYRMFTAQLPFQAKQDVELLANQLIIPVPPPSRRKRGLDDGIEAVILRATRKRPANRYRSMAEMLEDIERLLGERSGVLEGLREIDGPDVYEPQGMFSKNAAVFFYRKLGMDPPTFLL